MDKLAKALAKLSKAERQKIKVILERLLRRKLAGLDIKKLRGRSDIYRIRSGNFRIIYRENKSNEISILSISRRNERTYKDF